MGMEGGIHILFHRSQQLAYVYPYFSTTPLGTLYYNNDRNNVWSPHCCVQFYQRARAKTSCSQLKLLLPSYIATVARFIRDCH